MATRKKYDGDPRTSTRLLVISLLGCPCPPLLQLTGLGCHHSDSDAPDGHAPATTHSACCPREWGKLSPFRPGSWAKQPPASAHLCECALSCPLTSAHICRRKTVPAHTVCLRDCQSPEPTDQPGTGPCCPQPQHFLQALLSTCPRTAPPDCQKPHRVPHKLRLPFVQHRTKHAPSTHWAYTKAL